ncbi:hypothetical protein GF340_03430, partial [Candidatus Peregrinibacteria bacterium]|nr:hypothetical protein [Candidatus Peregrinibacteria bacterium]
MNKILRLTKTKNAVLFIGTLLSLTFVFVKTVHAITVTIPTTDVSFRIEIEPADLVQFFSHGLHLPFYNPPPYFSVITVEDEVQRIELVTPEDNIQTEEDRVESESEIDRTQVIAQPDSDIIFYASSTDELFQQIFALDSIKEYLPQPEVDVTERFVTNYETITNIVYTTATLPVAFSTSTIGDLEVLNQEKLEQLVNNIITNYATTVTASDGFVFPENFTFNQATGSSMALAVYLTINGIRLDDSGGDNQTSGATLVGVFDEFANSNSETLQDVLYDFDTGLSTVSSTLALAILNLDSVSSTIVEMGLQMSFLSERITGNYEYVRNVAGETAKLREEFDALSASTSAMDLQQVTDVGNQTTNAIQFAGGTSTAAVYIQSVLNVTGLTTLSNLVFANATGTNLALSNSLSIGGIQLSATGISNLTSGATLVGVFDEFVNSNGTNVQEVLADLDTAISTASSTAMSLDFDNIYDQSIANGNPQMEIDNGDFGIALQGSNDLYIDLQSSGDFTVQDNGTGFFYIRDNRSMDYTFTGNATDAIDVSANSIRDKTIVDVSADGLTSGEGMSIERADNSGYDFTNNSTGLLSVRQLDNEAGSIGTALFVEQSGTGYAIDVQSGDVNVNDDLIVAGYSNLQLATFTNATGTNFALTGYVNSDLLPMITDQYYLGDATQRWLGLFAKNVTTTNLSAVNIDTSKLSASLVTTTQLFVGGMQITSSTGIQDLQQVTNQGNVTNNWIEFNGGTSTDALKIESGEFIGSDVLYVHNTFGGGGGNALHVETEGGNWEPAVYIENDGVMPGLLIENKGAGNQYGLIVDGGFVGFGTTTPDAALTVFSDPGEYAHFAGTDDTKGFYMGADLYGNDLGIAYNDKSDMMISTYFGGSVPNAYDYVFLGNRHLTVRQASGNVGIGTQDPSLFTLQVAGNVGPNAHNIYDLGSATTSWRNIYAAGFVSTTALYINGIAVTTSLPTLAQVTSEGNITTDSIQFAGGTSTADFAVQGNLISDYAVFTAATSSDLYATTFGFDSAVGAEFVAGDATTTNLFATNLEAVNANLSNLDYSHATGTGLALSSFLTINGIRLDDVGVSNIASGATLVGVFDEFANSNATTVQAVLADFDSWITTNANDIAYALSELATATSTIATIITDLNSVSSTLATTISDLQSVSSTLSQTQTELQSVSSTVATNTANIAQNAADILQVSSTAAQNTQDISDLETDLAIATSSIAQVSSTAAQNTQDISSVSSSLAGTQTDLDTVSTTLSNVDLQYVTDRGALTTNAIQFAGGTSTAAVYIQSVLNVTG